MPNSSAELEGIVLPYLSRMASVFNTYAARSKPVVDYVVFVKQTIEYVKETVPTLESVAKALHDERHREHLLLHAREEEGHEKH